MAHVLRVGAGRLVVAAVTAALVASLGACGLAGDRGPARIIGYSVDVDDAGALHLVVGTCHGDPEVTRLDVDATTVTVEVTSTTTDPGDGCADGVTATLDAPLGERVVVDATTGREVEPDWTWREVEPD